MIRSGRGWLVALVPALAVVGLALPALLGRLPRPAPGRIEPASLAPRPQREVALDTLARGRVLGDLMAERGLAATDIHAITGIVRAYKRPRTLLPGVVARFSGPPGGPPDRLRLHLTPDSVLHLAATDSGWAARLEVVPCVTDTVRLSGVIHSSLWMARLGGDVDRLADGGFQEFVYDLADVFAWRVDFTRDIQPGDGFRVAFERDVRPDGSVRERRFLAIELVNRGRPLRAIPFVGPEGRRAYYDADGRSLRGAFLRYPVPYRITSGFTGRRFHPVLKRYRPHRGIDYGAPHGTRVQATASGTVTRAGTQGSYGRMVELRHANGIVTRYAHLSAIAPGLRAGTRVEQGQFIGRVGASGLASGTHLHYEFLQDGRHRNPLSVQLPSEPSLDARHMEAFRRVRDAGLALIERIPPPPAPPLAALDDDGAPR